MQVPQISIVTPSFNQAEFLERTIRSVLDQAYPALEYIVMDGGSGDGSVEIIRRYASSLSHWESGPDGGQVVAIRRGFAMARGEILGWLNSDDMLMPGCLWTVAREFPEDPGTVAVGGRSVFVDAEGRPLGVTVPRARKSWKDMLFWGHGLAQMATFWRRRSYEEVGGLDTAFSFSFDYDLFVRLRRAGNIHLLPQYLAAFRLHSHQKTATSLQVGQSDDRRVRRKHGCGSYLWLSAMACRCRPAQRIGNARAWVKDRSTLRTVGEGRRDG
jgi:glycosyltransferase involved in cell wall biosynthesis